MIFAPIFIKIKLQQKKLRAYNAFITCTAFTWAHVMKFYEEKSCIFFICSIYCSQLIAVAAAVCSHSHNINREEKKTWNFAYFFLKSLLRTSLLRLILNHLLRLLVIVFYVFFIFLFFSIAFFILFIILFFLV